ncbi:MAG TPA: outer membrane protein transport protein [Thermodesulfobacteriota bacterium]|nr:outer membrane protein transport protein [Thermodesulfobacteriota bacterium]
MPFALPLALALLAGRGEATGFRITAHGAKAMGMAGAFAAQADDPSTIYYNPAGITQLGGTQLQGGFTFIVAPGPSFTPFPGQATIDGTTGAPSVAQNADVPGRVFPLPTFFATRQLTDRLAVGFGTYSPFGLAVDWPDTWTGRQITTFNELRSSYFDFVAAYDVRPWWTLAAGVDLVYSTAKLSRTTFVLPSPSTTESLLQFEGDGFGLAYELAALLRIGSLLKLGVSYRHQAVIEYDGDIDVIPPQGILASEPPSQSASTKLPLPSTLVIGLAASPTDKWTVEFDWDITFWESFRSLSLRIPGSPTLQQGFESSAPFPNRRWKDSHILRLGTEYQVARRLALRLGAAYITTPIPDETLDPVLPDADRTSLTAGLGYVLRQGLSLDLAYEYQHFHDRTKNNEVPQGPQFSSFPGLRANGLYETDAHVFVAQIKYSFR